jgi:hypothetical protein
MRTEIVDRVNQLTTALQLLNGDSPEHGRLQREHLLSALREHAVELWRDEGIELEGVI